MAAASGISRLGDLESGHQCWFPVVGTGASKNVLVNKKPTHKIGDKTKIHKCSKNVHPDTMVKGSKKVFVNKKPVVRIGDALSPGGAVMAQGSHSVLAGG